MDAKADVPASALLMAAFGPFCMLSERPLPSGSYVWRTGTAREMGDAPAMADDWNDLYLLDEATFAAVSEQDAPKDILLPDRASTFRLQDSPFVYGLEEVRIVFLDEEGEPMGEPTMERLAVVRGTTPEAERTIEAFALNTRWFDADNKELRMPHVAYLSMDDHRLHERTIAWRRAEQAADLVRQALAQGLEESIGMLLDQVRLTANAAGYWSVWATVLWRELEDRDMVLRSVSMPEEDVAHGLALLAETDKREVIREHLGYGPHNAFPGTRVDWLK